MMQKLTRLVLIAIVSLAVLGLAACGDSEDDQRKAFMAFLQTRILDKPGIHVPQLTDDEKKAFGPYADHYAVITAFHETMNRSVSPKLASAMSSGSIHSLDDLVSHRDAIATAKATLDQMGAALGSDKEQADAAHAKLSQPADLKPVYDKVYDRLVTKVAQNFGGIMPMTDKVLAAGLDLGDFIAKHKNSVKIEGVMLQVSDPNVRTELNAKLQALQSDQQGMIQAQSTLRTMMYGQ